MGDDNVLMTESNYLKFLPALYQSSGEEGKASFVSRYLKIFEKVLSGIDDDVLLSGKYGKFRGIAKTLNEVSDYFHPLKTEPEFLDWFASWMGLLLKEGWSEKKKREIVSKIIPIYRIRGTKRGLEEFIKIYIGAGVQIGEVEGSFPVGLARVGVNSIIGEGMKPYFFTVKVNLTATTPSEIKRKTKSIKAIIDMEKPVHTSYALSITVPTLRIGHRDGSTVGLNTLIGGTKTEVND